MRNERNHTITSNISLSRNKRNVRQHHRNNHDAVFQASNDEKFKQGSLDATPRLSSRSNEAFTINKSNPKSWKRCESSTGSLILPFMSVKQTKALLKKEIAQKFSSKVEDLFRPGSLPNVVDSNHRIETQDIIKEGSHLSIQKPVFSSWSNQTGPHEKLTTRNTKKINIRNLNEVASQEEKLHEDREKKDALMQLRLKKKNFDYLRQAFAFKDPKKPSAKQNGETLLRESDRLDGRIKSIERDRPNARLALPESRLR